MVKEHHLSSSYTVKELFASLALKHLISNLLSQGTHEAPYFSLTNLVTTARLNATATIKPLDSNII